MHFNLLHITNYATIQSILRTTSFEEGAFVYSLVFENEEKTKGFINKTPKHFPFTTSNVVAFTMKKGLFLLESSASSYPDFKRIVAYVAPNAHVVRYKNEWTKEHLQAGFGECLKSFQAHPKGWYVTATFQFEAQNVTMEYAPLTGKGNTSMLLTNELRDEVIEKLLEVAVLTTEKDPL